MSRTKDSAGAIPVEYDLTLTPRGIDENNGQSGYSIKIYKDFDTQKHGGSRRPDQNGSVATLLHRSNR